MYLILYYVSPNLFVSLSEADKIQKPGSSLCTNAGSFVIVLNKILFLMRIARIVREYSLCYLQQSCNYFIASSLMVALGLESIM